MNVEHPPKAQALKGSRRGEQVCAELSEDPPPACSSVDGASVLVLPEAVGSTV